MRPAQSAGYWEADRSLGRKTCDPMGLQGEKIVEQSGGKLPIGCGSYRCPITDSESGILIRCFDVFISRGRGFPEGLHESLELIGLPDKTVDLRRALG